MSTQNRLKVLHITPWYPTAENPVEGTFIREHIRAAAINHDVVVWAIHIRPDMRGGAIEVSDSVEDGLRTFRTWQGVGGVLRLRYLSRLRQQVKFGERLIGSLGRPDIIHAHILPAAVPAALLGRKFGIPLIITEQWTGYERGLLTTLEKLKARFAFGNARVVLPVSRYLGEQMMRCGIRANYKVVPNAVDTTLFYPRSSPRPVASPLRFLMVAVQRPVKGTPLLLEAANLLKKLGWVFQLDIVGGGPSLHDYEAMAHGLGLGESVRFTGTLPKPEIAALMRQCDFLVHPSLVETFCAVIAEALCCGLPVVASDIQPLPDLVNQSNGILFPSGDISALVDALKRMAAEHNHYNSAAISEQASAKFSLPAVAAQLDEIYRGVAVNA